MPPLPRIRAPLRRAALATALLAAAAALLPLAGCGERAEKAPAGRLSLVLLGGAETLDPQRNREDLTRALLHNFYEGLVELDPELNLRPALAADWSSPSDTVWRLRLREGVLFHDGSPFGPEDVKRTIERARAVPDSTVEPDVRAVREVRVVDGSTVELVTDRPRPLLLAKLATVPILPRATGDAEITVPIGTGPYRYIGRGARATGVLAGKRFERYWGTAPDFDLFEVHAIQDDGERVRAAEDWADVVSPYPTESGSGPVPARISVVTHPTVTVSFLVCRISAMARGRPSPLRDRRVREALSLAVDRPALVREALPDGGVPLWQLVVPGVHGFDPGLSREPRDVARARELLAEAGHPGGLDLPLVVSPRGRAVAAVLSRQLAEAGIRLVVEPLGWRERYRRMQAGETELALASWTTATGDASGLFEPLLHSAGAGAGAGSENTTGFADPEVDALLERAASEMSPGSRAVLLQAVMRRALAELPLIPLYSPSWTYGVRTGLSFTPRLDFAVFAASVRKRPPGP